MLEEFKRAPWPGTEYAVWVKRLQKELHQFQAPVSVDKVNNSKTTR